MSMSVPQAIMTISVVALATMITRFLPFVLFPQGKPTPRIVAYLGRVLPYSVIGLLIVYCLKGVSLLSGSYGMPEALSILAIAAVHIWKRNVLLSIATGTIVYMLLIQLVF